MQADGVPGCGLEAAGDRISSPPMAFATAGVEATVNPTALTPASSREDPAHSGPVAGGMAGPGTWQAVRVWPALHGWMNQALFALRIDELFSET